MSGSEPRLARTGQRIADRSQLGNSWPSAVQASDSEESRESHALSPVFLLKAEEEVEDSWVLHNSVHAINFNYLGASFVGKALFWQKHS